MSFQDLAAPHRRALHVHCYRMVGSFSDAEDLVQDTLERAWKARDSFVEGGEVGMRRWLYRIATNACLDWLKSAARRVQSDTAAAGSIAEVPWLEPYPDRLLDELPADDATSPDAAVASKETIALGFLALIQLLPPQQRAVFVLREVLGWSAAETASLLEISVAAANSALQRARETIDRSRTAPASAPAPTEIEREVLAQFIAAHERGDTAASVALMARDLRVTMPPNPWCFDGRDAIAPLLSQAWEMGEWKLVPAWANRMPCAASYLRRPGDTAFRAFKLDVIRARPDGLVQEITTFDAKLFAAFGLAEVLE
jgi:RNA polymerase sigma-70 factor (TIGR02960 family)